MQKDICQIMNKLMMDPFWEFKLTNKPDNSIFQTFIHDYHIPADFKEMLLIADGFTLKDGAYCINDINIITQTEKKYAGIYSQKGVLDNIGYFIGYYLAIDQTQYNTNHYLYIGEECSGECYSSVGTITNFLYEFIQAKGEMDFFNLGTPDKLKVQVD